LAGPNSIRTDVPIKYRLYSSGLNPRGLTSKYVIVRLDMYIYTGKRLKLTLKQIVTEFPRFGPEMAQQLK